jgi:protein TonB
MVVVAFEWETVDRVSAVDLGNVNTQFEDVFEEVPVTNQPPPPPQVQQPQIVEVPDEEEIVEEIEIDLDVEITEDTKIEDVVFEAAPEEEKADEVFTVVEEMPTFPGGTGKFYEYVSQNLDYPTKAKKAAIEGRVILRFVVGVEGDISNVEVLRGIGFGCDEEAVRVIQSSPKWIPGKQRGRSVKVSVTVPLSFRLS